MNEENEDVKKASVKNTVVVNGSSTTMGSKKINEKRLLPTTPSTSNNKTDIHASSPFSKQVVSSLTNSKPDVHASTPFTNQVVHDVRIPQTLVKTKSSGCTSNTKMGSATSSVLNASGDNKKLIDKALKARLYFLQQTGPHQFLIGGDSPDHKYRITIGSQKCSCGKDNLCVHIYFIMLRVFQVPINDPILSKRTLKNFEVETLLRNFSARRRSKIKSLTRSTSIKKDHPKPIDAIDGNSANSSSSLAMPATKDSTENILNENCDEETCPICLLELVEGESLTECKECQNKYHQHCIDIWTLECSQQKEPIVCPLCRAAWKGTKSSANSGNEEQGTSGSGVTLLDDLTPDLRIVVSEWLKIFSNDLVQKLTSKNWTDREIGLRHFPDEVLMLGFKTADHESCSLATFESAVHVLSHFVLDPVYKVFVAALRAFRNILFFTPCQSESQQSHLRFILQPFIKSLFVKCSDSNKKTGLLAISTLEEFVKGQEGELSVGRDVSNGTNSLPLGHPDYLLSLILRNNDPCLLNVEEWQLVYGKLIILNKLTQIFSDMFLFSDQNQNSATDSNCCAGVDNSYQSHFSFDVNSHSSNKNLFLDFCLKYLSHPHVRISLTSRNILLCITRLNARKSEGLYHRILSHVSNSALIDSSLKETLLSKLLRIEEEIKTPDGRNESPSDGRRKSIPSVQNERMVRNRPGSSRTNWFTRSGSFKMSSERSRRVKSSTASPVLDPWYRRSPVDRRRCFKKNLSVSDDSVFKSTESSLTPEMISSIRGVPIRGRYSEYERDVGIYYSLNRSFSEFSIVSKRQIATKRKDVIKYASKVKCKDAATSTSPPLATTSDESSSKKTPRPSKPPLWKEAKHSRQCSGGSVKDFEDMVSSTPGSEKVSFKTEVASTPYSSPQTTMGENCPCKEEVDKEEAEALARALDISDKRQEALPFVPGLSASNPKMMSQSLSEELKETKISWTSFTSNGSPNNDAASATGKMSAYEENVHWKRGPILGSGAACTCYQARDVKTGTLMAVKLISFCRNTVEEQDKVKNMIVDEVHTLAQLNHPNIVRILGATLQSTHVFMFFEWMPGRSLSSLLEMYGPFSESVVTKYTLQILKGLVYLHDNQILHRDLKGANILVDSTGQRLRIGDFGTSARLSSSRTLQGEFQGQLLGTVAFMAPEVLKGADYGRSCDIWSLGCCMIEMLTGSPPWIAKHLSNHLALMFKIASSDKPPPIPENVNPAIKDFLLRCLDVNPSERPAAKDLLKHPLFRI